MRLNATSKRAVVSLAMFTLLAGFAVSTNAKPVTPALTLQNIDWTSAGVGGVGGKGGVGGSGSINLTGVSGPVKKAFLYWHGIDNLLTSGQQTLAQSTAVGSVSSPLVSPTVAAGCDGVYNVPTVLFNGVPVTGIVLGDATTNCWGNGSSRAFRADVTPLVTGNGSYTVSDVVTDACDDLNGASLVVTFDDGNAANNRDIVLFEGNDSNIADGFPGETDGWHAVLPGIVYSSGAASVEVHLADGQTFDPGGLDDNALVFSAGGPAVVIPDAFNRYDGQSLADAGHSRSLVPGLLWDIHRFDISALFTSIGLYTLSVDGQDPYIDCTGLVLLIVDLKAGSAPVVNKTRSWGEVKAMYR